MGGGCNCYADAPSCETCYNTCYGYQACSCNNTCYTQTCTCNLGDSGESGCACDDACYGEFVSMPAPLIRLGGVDYVGDYQVLTGDFTDYEYVWTQDPSAAADWGRTNAHSIEAFGVISGSGTVGTVNIDVSQIYLYLSWFPNQPIGIVRVFKNNVEVETVFKAIPDAGEESDQVINISSLLSLTKGDTIRVSFTKVSNNLDMIIGDTAYTFLSVHRVEGQCV